MAGVEGALVAGRAEPPREPGVVEIEAPIEFAVPDLEEGDVEAITRVLRSGWLTTGDECAALEAELAEYLGVEHVLAVSSCTAALEIAFAHLDLPPGAKVGVPTWTYVASALSPLHHGAEPVLLDVDPDSLNVGYEPLARALEDGLDAAVLVHFAGTPVEDRVRALCADAGVPVVEDAAHALGAVDGRGRLAGQGSVGAAFSFYATKNLSSGEGGALATEDDELARFARSWRLHGLAGRPRASVAADPMVAPELVGAGIKANLPDLLAALARSQLRRFDALQQRRAEIVAWYRDGLADLDGLRCVPAERHEGSADHLFVVVLPEGVDRTQVVHALEARGVGTSFHFHPLHRFPWMAAHSTVGSGGTPVADELASRALSLPLHPRLTEADVARVCGAVEDALSS